MRYFGLLLAVLMVTLFATPSEASAQTAVDGNWLLVLNSPVGLFEIPVSVVQDGELVLATLAVEAPDGQEFSLEGSLQGSAIHWSAEVDYEGMPIVISLSGSVSEATMSGTADYGGMAQGDWSARRAEG
ncbi:MAG: hypothetical protein ACOC8K_09310 [Gemmatimonadota bacterium]